MKKYIILTLAAASILLAGCESDSSNSSECNNDEVKADCNNGKYSKCVDGKWTETLCEGDASCNAENKCGVCQDDAVDETCADGKYKKCTEGKWEETACENNASCNEENKCGKCSDGDEKADCKDGKYSKCVNGKWTETACADNSSCTKDGTCGKCQEGAVKDCENNNDNIGMATICKDGQWSETKVECPSESGKVSCTADKQCGECKNGDNTQCTNGLEDVGKAIMCTNGKWDKDPSYCPEHYSCAMSNDCYQCLSSCDTKNSCPDDCTDSECEEKCKLNADCKTQCNNKYGGCESKCGECVNGDMLNCVEDNNGVGSADYCYNGTWAKNHDCATIYKAIYNVEGLTVSCIKKCTKQCGDTTCCRDDEYISICGECKNAKTGQPENDLICVKQYDNKYGIFYPQFPYEYQLVKCVEGKISENPNDGATPCSSSCFGTDGYAACKQTGKPGE